MRTSKTIAAIDKDAEVLVFGLVDCGVLGDLFDVVHRRTEGIKIRKG